MNMVLNRHLSLWNSLRNSNFMKMTIETNRRSYSTPIKSTTPRHNNEPFRFVGSPAADWSAEQTRSGTTNFKDVPWFQTYSVVGSVAIFLIYFCILREESDVDRELEKSLYERVPGLEQTQLVINYKYNIENNIENGPIVARMKELGMNPEDIKL